MSKEEKGFSLPDERVTVKFIPRKKGMAADVSADHIMSGGMLEKSVRKFSAPLQRNGKIANVLTSAEKEFLEKELGGLDLSVYGDFWKTFYVPLRKTDASNRFNTKDPIDYISLKILEANSNVIATSWSERNNKATYQYAITKEDEISSEVKSKLDFKKKAFKLYGKIEDDRDQLLGVLRLMSNKPTSNKSKLVWLQGEVEKHVDTNPAKFLSVVEDANFEIKKLITEAVDSGYIIRKGNRYSTKDGLDLCENGETPSFSMAVKYLSKDKNQEVKNIIEAKIEKNK